MTEEDDRVDAITVEGETIDEQPYDAPEAFLARREPEVGEAIQPQVKPLSQLKTEAEDMRWFDELEETLSEGLEERIAYRKKLVREGEAFKTVENDVGNIIGLAWDYFTRE